MERLNNVHPGEILLEEFLKSMGITSHQLANDIVISQIHINEILNGQREITADIALRFSKYFGTTSRFWLGLQNDFDLEKSSIAP
jgi:addiction module HigA family antidote